METTLRQRREIVDSISMYHLPGDIVSLGDSLFVSIAVRVHDRWDDLLKKTMISYTGMKIWHVKHDSTDNDNENLLWRCK